MDSNSTNPNNPNQTIAVTGPTGYVGGRLVPILLNEGYTLRCIAREPRKLDDRDWRSSDSVSVLKSDLSDVDALTEILGGCTAAYYLVHSMEASGQDYADRDRTLASNFAQAAKAAGVERIIYLGGLGDGDSLLSEHLSSRREVEKILGSTGVPVTVFRAAMIIGSGSVSFEILRYLVERLPIMITPSWVMTESQPVAIADVLHWLVRCLRTPSTTGQILEIGGADVFPYKELMKIMQEELKLTKRIIIPVPVLTPRLSSGWISLVTPVSYRIARPLADGLRNKVVVTNDLTQELMPHDAMGVREAIAKALIRIESNDVQTRWSVAGPIPGDPNWAGGTTFTDARTITINATPQRVFAAICRIGGGHGWYAADILWKVRGWMDTIAGGPGLRRGRRDPERVEFGESLDFWRVIGITKDESLILRAEMKLPGDAILSFNIEPVESTGSPDSADSPSTNITSTNIPSTNMTMTAKFHPKGILGILYWYSVLPFHGIVFKGMLKGIKRAAESQTSHTNQSASQEDHQPPPKG